MAARRKFPNWMNALGTTVLQMASNTPAAQAIQDGAPRRVLDQLGSWFGHLSQQAMIHWSTSMLSGVRCSFCDEDALGKCIACGDPCCLGHSHVSYRAELLCDECVGSLLQKTSREKGPVEVALEYFRLTREASLEDLKAMYRHRSKSIHPDRGGTDREMSTLNQHYRVLTEHFERRAA